MSHEAVAVRRIFFSVFWQPCCQAAAQDSDLVDFSVGSPSDSQQDLEVVLRVLGGDIQSGPLMEIHSEVLRH